MPSHTHSLTRPAYFNSEWKTGNEIYAINDMTSAIVTSATLPAGGSLAHENRPPYLAVYMWRRTA